MKKPTLLVLIGHPASDSFCEALAKSYAEGAWDGGAEVRLLPIRDLEFAPLADPRMKELEPDLVQAQDLISAASQLTFVYPLWWGSSPALLKGFVDRAFTSGFAFEYVEGQPLPRKLLKGRKGRIIMTMDSPTWWHSLLYRSSGTTWLRWATLWFSGFKTSKPLILDQVRRSTPEKRTKWLKVAREAGKRDAMRLSSNQAAPSPMESSVG